MRPLLRRALRAALRCYPIRIRDEFGPEVEAMVSQSWDDEAPGRSAGGRVLLAVRLLGDVVRSGLAFRLDPFRSIVSPRGFTMRALPYDLRLAVRSLAKAPGFTLTAAGVLAVGLAICTAVYTVARHVLMRPLPYPDPSRLVMLWDVKHQTPGFHNVVSPGNAADWRASARSFTGITVFNSATLAIDADGGRERVSGARVSTNYLDVLGVQPRLGRTFRPSDVDPGAPLVAVLSDGFWRRQMGGDPAAIGRFILSESRRFEVIGVMPPGFQGPEEHYFGRSEFWVPGWGNLEAGGRGGHFLRVFARLRDGISIEAASAEMALIAARSAQAHPETNRDWTAIVVPMRDEIVGEVRPVLQILLAAVFVVQLTVCANVAGLLLSRGAGRSREYAVRAAIGADARRLAQGIAAETLVLALGSAMAALILAGWLCHALVAIAPDIPRIDGLRLDTRAMGFAVALSIATALLAALMPAAVAIRIDPARALNDSSRSSTSVSRRRIRRVLVAAELAASVTLLIGAGLLTHSFVRLVRTPVGFVTDNVTTARVGLPSGADAPDPGRLAVAIADGLRILPGVRDAGVSTSLPLYGLNNVSLRIQTEPPAGPTEVVGFYRAVTPGYMRAVQLELATGRLLADTDHATAPGAMVVNEEFARQLGASDPLGTRVRFEFGERTFDGTIVGVVKGVRHHSPLDAPEPEVYVPYVQHPVLAVLMVAARAADPLTSADLRTAVRTAHPRLTIDDVQPASELHARAVAPQQFNALLMLLLAAVTLVLATVGLYAVIAQTVGQRMREIGIRLALGASRRQVLRLVLAEGMVVAAAGTAIGTGVAYAFAATLSQLLFGVQPHDPLVFASVPGLLLLVATAAVWLPAHRAASVDPVIALRGE